MYELYEKEDYIFANVPVKVYFHSLKGENIYTYLHWHTSVEFNLTTSGRILTLISGKKREQMAGEWNVVNSGELHGNYWVQTNDFYEGFTVLFSKIFLTAGWEMTHVSRFRKTKRQEKRLRRVSSGLESWIIRSFLKVWKGWSRSFILWFF